MVCEEESASNDIPSNWPLDVLLIEKDTHELWNSERGVGLNPGSA